MPEGGFLDFIAQYGIWLLGINIGLSFIGAAMAKKRGYSYGGFLFLGFFTSFIVNLIVAACLKPKPDSEYYHPRVKYSGAAINCGSCGSVCTQDMDFCPKCGSKLKNRCSSCGAQYSEGMSFCPKCGTQLSDW